MVSQPRIHIYRHLKPQTQSQTLPTRPLIMVSSSLFSTSKWWVSSKKTLWTKRPSVMIRQLRSTLRFWPWQTWRSSSLKGSNSTRSLIISMSYSSSCSRNRRLVLRKKDSSMAYQEPKVPSSTGVQSNGFNSPRQRCQCQRLQPLAKVWAPSSTVNFQSKIRLPYLRPRRRL